MIDESRAVPTVDWRRGGLIGAFAGALGGGLWAALAGAILAALGIAKVAEAAPLLDWALWVGWLFAGAGLAIHFGILAVPVGATVGGLGGLAWRGRTGRIAHVAAAAVGAVVGAGLWFAGVESSAGRENIPLGPGPGLVTGAIAGWLFIQLAQRAAAASPAGPSALSAPRQVLFSQAAGCVGGAIGMLALGILWQTDTILRNGDFSAALLACALTGVFCTVPGAFHGMLRRRPVSSPPRSLLVLCGLSGALYWITEVSADLASRFSAVYVLSSPIAALAAGLYAAWWTLARLLRSRHGIAPAGAG